MSENDDCVIRVIVFNGEPEEWNYWEEKFLARGGKKGFKDVLTGVLQATNDSKTLDLMSAVGKEKNLVKKQNTFGIWRVDFVHWYEQGQGEDCIPDCEEQQNYWEEGGDVALVWKWLKEKYAPKIAPRKVKLMQEFQKMTLKSSGEDPDVWLTNLESIQMKLAETSYTISDKQLMIHIMNNLPKEYNIQVSKLESQLNDQNNSLMVNNIQTELTLRYVRIKNKNGSTNDKECGTEQAVAAIQRIKGKCNKCGSIGHKAANYQLGGAGGMRCNDNNNNVHEGNGNGPNWDNDHDRLPTSEWVITWRKNYFLCKI